VESLCAIPLPDVPDGELEDELVVTGSEGGEMSAEVGLVARVLP
jgi:hypothetical protein